jgi:hypothetical protein
MQGDRIKIVDDKQVRQLSNFKNTKGKLLRTNAAIWFNKMCRIIQIKPNYIVKCMSWAFKNVLRRKCSFDQIYLVKARFHDPVTTVYISSLLICVIRCDVASCVTNTANNTQQNPRYVTDALC